MKICPKYIDTLLSENAFLKKSMIHLLINTYVDTKLL